MLTDESSAVEAPSSTSARTEASSLWSNLEEEHCCRVCHGEAEEKRPLFHPCRCKGSIKFVHQDCLQTWLKVSNDTHPKCELCGEYFNFRNIYAAGLEGKPPSLTPFEFVRDLCLMGWKAVANYGKIIIVIAIWLICFPYITHCIVLFTECFADDEMLCSKRMFPMFLIPSSTLEFTTYWLKGVESSVFALFFCMFSKGVYDVIVMEKLNLERLVVIANLEVKIKALDEFEHLLDNESTTADNLGGLETMRVESSDEKHSEVLNANTLACSDELEWAAKQTVIDSQEVGTRSLINTSTEESHSSEKRPFLAFVYDSSMESILGVDSAAPAIADLSLGGSGSGSNRAQRAAAYVSGFEHSAPSESETPLKASIVAVGLTNTEYAELTDPSSAMASDIREMSDYIDSSKISPVALFDSDATATLSSEDQHHEDDLTEDEGPLVADAAPLVEDALDAAVDVDRMEEQAVVLAPIPAPAGLFPVVHLADVTYLDHATTFLVVVAVEYAYFVLCVTLPALTGRGSLHLMNVRHTSLEAWVAAGLSSWVPHSTLLHMPLTAEDAARWQLLLFRLEHFLGSVLLSSLAILIAIGWLLIVFANGPTAAVFSTRLKAHYKNGVLELSKMSKLLAVLTLEIMLVPALLGTLSILLLLKSFKFTMKSALELGYIFGSRVLLIVWSIGLLAECHLENIMAAFENIMVKRALLGVASRFGYYHQQLNQNIEEVPLSVHAKQHMVNCCFFIPALLLTILVPLKLGRFFTPVVVVARNTEDATFLPTTLLHIVIPFLIERLQYVTVLRFGIETVMNSMCQYLDLNDLLLDPPKEDDAPLVDPPAPLAPQHQFPELDPVIVGLQMPGTGIRTVPSVEVTSEAPPTSWLTEMFLLRIMLEKALSPSAGGDSRASEELRAFLLVYFVKGAASINSTVDDFITETLRLEFSGIIEERIKEEDAKQDGAKGDDKATVTEMNNIDEIESLCTEDHSPQPVDSNPLELETERIPERDPSGIMDGLMEIRQTDAAKAKAKEQEDIEKEFSLVVLEEQASKRAALKDLKDTQEEEVTTSVSTGVSDISEEEQKKIMAAAAAAYDASDSSTLHQHQFPLTPTKQTPSSSNPNLKQFPISDADYQHRVKGLSKILRDLAVNAVFHLSTIKSSAGHAAFHSEAEIMLKAFRSMEFKIIALLKFRRKYGELILKDYLALTPMSPTTDSPDAARKRRVAYAIRRHCIAFNAEFRFSTSPKVGLWGKRPVEVFEIIRKRVRELPRRVRQVALLVLVAMVYCATVTFVITVPYLVGHSTLKVISNRAEGISFNSHTIGFAVCLGAYYTGQYMRKEILSNSNVIAFLRMSYRWFLIVLKAAVLGCLAMIAPLIAGYLIRSVACSEMARDNQSLRSFVAESWTLGILGLKLWIRYTMGVAGSQWGAKFDKILLDGLVNSDFRFIAMSVIAPITLWLLDFLIVPYFFAKVLSHFTDSYETQTLLVRNSWAVYIALRIGMVLLRRGYGEMLKLHDSIRDSKYLLRKELTNVST